MLRASESARRSATRPTRMLRASANRAPRTEEERADRYFPASDATAADSKRDCASASPNKLAKNTVTRVLSAVEARGVLVWLRGEFL